MEGLLDLGFNTPASSGHQQQQQQQQSSQPQRLNIDPFGVPQNPAQPPQQVQQPNQQVNFDPFGVPPTSAPQSPAQQTPSQLPGSGFDDAFGAAQPNTQHPGQQTNLEDAFGVPQQQAVQQPQSGAPRDSEADFDSIFTDPPKAPVDPNQPLQPHELDFDVLVVSKPPQTHENKNVGGASTSASASQPKESTPTSGQSAQATAQAVPADKANGSSANMSSVEQATTQPNSESDSKSKDGAALDNKAKLKEINRLFGGKWRLIRSDPYAEYLKAAGVGILTRNRASSGTQDLQISVLDDHIYVNTSSTLHSQINKFKLDEAFENVVLKTNQSVFCTYNNNKLELQMTPVGVAWSKTQGVQYSINERGELMVIYTAGSHTCRRCYVKVYEVLVR